MHTIPGGPISVATEVSPTGALFFLFSSVLRPRSRGSVTLCSADPTVAPKIRTGDVDHPDDLARMIEAVRHTRELFRTSPLRELVRGEELKPGVDVGSDEELAAAIRADVNVYHHACGTCPMGPAVDEGAVVDASGRVHGIEHLVVADASIMPNIPAANTNLPTLMLAERIAHLLRTEPQ
jgi:choline dehydrogenase